MVRDVSELATARLGPGAFALAAAALVFTTATADDSKETSPVVSREDAEFFEKQVRPLLVSKCQQCHGAKKQEYGLRLDTRAGLMKGSDGGAIVVPGKADDSSLVEAVRYGGSIRMPPDGKLKDVEIAALSEWVRRGAPWPESTSVGGAPSIDEAARTHWAFQPIARPPLPAVKNGGWIRMPIDRFILAKLEAAGLAPSPEADRTTLLRRLSFDLIGLPPTPEEIEQFVADPSADAYERLVDRLLASPRHGERWARYWLDVARFADTKGYVFFENKNYPWAWTYRDYVIRAFNQDLPYDQFVREQIAADQIAGAPRESLAAMGFLTAGNHFMNNQHDILDDRIDVVARGILGLTVGCARCHDHKFDPIPAADYYSLYGIFRSSQEPLVPPLLNPAPATDEFRKFDLELSSRLRKFDAFVDQKFHELANGGRTRAGEYLKAAHANRNQPTTEDFMLITDKGDLNPVMIVRWQKYLEETKKSRHPVWSLWHEFAALEDAPPAVTGGAAAIQPTFAERAALVLQKHTAADASAPTVNPLVRAEFVDRPVPQSMQEVIDRHAALLARIDAQWTTIPALAEAPGFDVSTIAATRLADPAAEEVRLVLYGVDAPANLARMLGWGFLSLVPDRASQDEFKKLIGEVENWMATGAGAPPRAMALVDDKVPYEPRVFLRGNPNRLGLAVPRQAPRIAATNRKPFSEGSGRRELADVLTSRDNPLTSRVMANRIWLHHFGAALVGTAGDFGLRSDPPTHPELLNWLAAELQGQAPTEPSPPAPPGGIFATPHQWSLKRLHRQIVLSATYRQQSSPPSGPQPSTLNPQTSADPENRLLGKANRRRLDFEALRDNLVAVTGTLDTKIGGPSVALLGTFLPSRTLYGQIDRQDLATLYRDYDFPDPAASSPQREATTVPPQALFLMNNPFMQAVAIGVINRHDVRTKTTVEARFDRVWQILFTRPATDRERRIALDFLGPNPTQDRWQQYIHALLMTNEFAFVD